MEEFVKMFVDFSGSFLLEQTLSIEHFMRKSLLTDVDPPDDMTRKWPVKGCSMREFYVY